jgi:hypothetical protein
MKSARIDILNSWQLLEQQSSPTNVLIPTHQCSWICRTFHHSGRDDDIAGTGKAVGKGQRGGCVRRDRGGSKGGGAPNQGAAGGSGGRGKRVAPLADGNDVSGGGSADDLSDGGHWTAGHALSQAAAAMSVAKAVVQYIRACAAGRERARDREWQRALIMAEATVGAAVAAEEEVSAVAQEGWGQPTETNWIGAR